jgi:hypothetical protein
MPNYKVTLVNYRDCVVDAPDKATAEQWAENRPDDVLFQDLDTWTKRAAVEEAGADKYSAATVCADGSHTWNYGFD